MEKKPRRLSCPYIENGCVGICKFSVIDVVCPYYVPECPYEKLEVNDIVATYLLKVKQYDITLNDYRLKVYKVKTNDIYHVIGKIYCNAFERIESMSYGLWTKQREEFWEKEGYSVVDYKE
ncbi:MAG: hypothetical protein K2L52_03510 [Clostridia bacterium]|nr:hypothetical protein [Clostridia bacterium]